MLDTYYIVTYLRYGLGFPPLFVFIIFFKQFMDI